MAAIEAPEKVSDLCPQRNGLLPSESSPQSGSFPHGDEFAQRHIGPNPDEVRQMLDLLGQSSLDALTNQAVPAQIRLERPLELPPAKSEFEVLAILKEIASQNQVCRSFIGMGYYGCVTPAVIQRNLLENPGWYTQYTPYQAEI